MGSLRNLHSEAKKTAIPSNQASDTKNKIEQLLARLLSFTKVGIVQWEVDAYALHRFQKLGFSWRCQYMGYEFYIVEAEPGIIDSFVIIEGEAGRRAGTKIYREPEVTNNYILQEMYGEAVSRSGFEDKLREETLFNVFGI